MAGMSRAGFMDPAYADGIEEGLTTGFGDGVHAAMGIIRSRIEAYRGEWDRVNEVAKFGDEILDELAELIK